MLLNGGPYLLTLHFIIMDGAQGLAHAKNIAATGEVHILMALCAINILDDIALIHIPAPGFFIEVIPLLHGDGFPLNNALPILHIHFQPCRDG